MMEAHFSGYYCSKWLVTVDFVNSFDIFMDLYREIFC